MSIDNAAESQAPDLATLLRSWRTRLQPADVGLPFRPGTRKTAGLRREEVAWLAGISPDYVKRLEQGRAHPSLAILHALARTLRLSDAEYELACRLAGHAAPPGTVVPQHIGPSVQRLLDRLGDTPIAVFDAAWTLIQHNEPWTALTGDDWRDHGGWPAKPTGDDRRGRDSCSAELAGDGRRGRGGWSAKPTGDGRRDRGGWPANIVWRVFHGATGRVRHSDPEQHKASLVADLRDVATRYPADRELTKMIGALRAASPEFARLWEGSAVGHHGNERKTIDHPQVGELVLDCDVLSVHGADLRIVVYTAAPGTEAAEKLRLLTVLGLQEMPSSSVAGDHLTDL